MPGSILFAKLARKSGESIAASQEHNRQMNESLRSGGEHGERTARHLRNRTAMRVGALALVAGVGIYGVNKATDALDHITGMFMPHQLSIENTQSALSKITLPNDITVISAQMDAKAQLHTATAIFGVQVPGAGSDTYTAETGDLNVVVHNAGSSITLSSRKAADGNLQIVANVDPSALGLSTADVTIENSVASNGLIRRIMSVPLGSNDGSRVAALNNYANTYAEYACAPALDAALVPGIANSVHDNVETAAALLAPKDSQAAGVIRDLLKEPVAVQIGNSSTFDLQSVAPAVPTAAEFAHTIGSDPQYTQLVDPSCMLTANASNQLINIINDYNHPG